MQRRCYATPPFFNLSRKEFAQPHCGVVKQRCTATLFHHNEKQVKVIEQQVAEIKKRVDEMEKEIHHFNNGFSLP